MNWEDISKLGKSNIIKSSIIWVFIVPFITKVIIYFSNKYNIDIEMPFSWEIFYYSAILFMIGNFIFVYYCPKIIYENKNYSDFHNKGLGIFRLLEYSKNNYRIESKIEVTIENQNPNERDIFSELWNDSLLMNPLARNVIVVFYSLGFLLFSYIFLCNIITVIKYSLN